MFTTLNDYLNKLEKLTFVSADKNKIHTEEGYTISIHCDFLSTCAMERKSYPVQVVLRISSKEFAGLSRYGCWSNEDNAAACDWFFSKYYKLQNKNAGAEIEARRQAYKNLEKIIE